MKGWIDGNEQMGNVHSVTEKKKRSPGGPCLYALYQTSASTVYPKSMYRVGGTKWVVPMYGKPSLLCMSITNMSSINLLLETPHRANEKARRPSIHPSIHPSIRPSIQT
ncbi:hypothetical protein EYC84_008364 [Monilinia fructicola]|uniref:Uncharacterized protein n=1 Tax=Monilinia fructicola TaxID=38448 RepID=A0A5M9JLK5_MONFR|nr:hypothetical protein EYC84_008364 [Monilinia fructicola]